MTQKNLEILKRKREMTKNLADTLGMELLEISGERVVATMPVDDRTRQPFGILHGEIGRAHV